MTQRVVVVTGANRGLGLHLVHQFQQRGYDVVAACRRPADADALAALAPFAMLPLDTGDPESIGQFAETLGELVDRVDVLVNNAGVMMPSARPVDAHPDDNERANGPLGRLDGEAMLEVLRINSVGPVLTTQALVPLMGRGSVVLNMSSRLGSIGTASADEYAYAMSKAALNMATTVMARELAEAGVVVFAASPGWVRTDMGGGAATLEPDESTGALADLVGRVGIEQSGTFLGHTGDPIPW